MIEDKIKETLDRKEFLEERILNEYTSALTMLIGIFLAGGGALIKNLDKLISEKTGIPVFVAQDPLDCVVKGTEKTLEDLEKLKDVLINARKRR